ncbi:hypothetical protein FKN04_07560 [Bacillus glycinifermentans]|nr:hypothetical protein [Bacillus glycinifermentans]
MLLFSARKCRPQIQFAWDRHTTFLNAQSRAMGELRSLIKQFDQLAHEEDERRLRPENLNFRPPIKTTFELYEIFFESLELYF